MRNRLLAISAVALSAVSITATCGDDDGGGSGGSGNGRITFPDSCPSFTPCGGDIQGTWTFDGACIPQSELLGGITDQCPDATVRSLTGRVTGTLTADATTITRTGELELNASIGLPSSCTMGLDCATVGSFLVMAGVQGSCSDASDGCTCNLDVSQSADETTGYTASGNTVTATDGTTYDYCVSGGTLTYREGGPDPAPGVFTLSM